MHPGDDDDFSQKILASLPADPFEQLEMAQKITSIATAAVINKLEGETTKLRQKLGEKENTIHSMQQQMGELEHSLQDASMRLNQSLDEQEKLSKEKSVLTSMVQKLKREVSKLEMFKKNLLQSLQEDDDNASQLEESDNISQPTYISSIPNTSTLGKADDRNGTTIPRSVEHGELFGSVIQSAPSDLAPSQDDDQHPSVTSLPITPSTNKGSSSGYRWSMSGSDVRVPRSPPSQRTGVQSSVVPLSGQIPRVDGKEFFRQARFDTSNLVNSKKQESNFLQVLTNYHLVISCFSQSNRNRLSYQQFSAFLSNIKELNAHRQSREDTLSKAEYIFGPDNQDLYFTFDELITRHT